MHKPYFFIYLKCEWGRITPSPNKLGRCLLPEYNLVRESYLNTKFEFYYETHFVRLFCIEQFETILLVQHIST